KAMIKAVNEIVISDTCEKRIIIAKTVMEISNNKPIVNQARKTARINKLFILSLLYKFSMIEIYKNCFSNGICFNSSRVINFNRYNNIIYITVRTKSITSKTNILSKEDRKNCLNT